jgi:hypothetical protein
VGLVGVGLGTLLGPEETGPLLGSVFSSVGRLRFGVPLPGFRAWGGLFFENCIVDASILFLLF